jgi:hypothetical protein
MFGDYARGYWQRGFNPIPGKVEPPGQKVPQIFWKRYQRRRMAEATLGSLERTHVDAPLLMVCTGKVSGLTVVDVDGDEDDLTWAQQTFGEPRVLVETAGGGYHLWYRSSGEKRAIRVGGRPVDILGEGSLATVPGSEIDGALYMFKRGNTDTPRTPIKPTGLALLQAERRSIPSPEMSLGSVTSGKSLVYEGERDNKLFMYGKERVSAFRPSTLEEREAKFKEFEADLLAYNQRVNHPVLPTSQVRYKAKYLFRKMLEGTIFRKGVQSIGLEVDAVLKLLCTEDPFALAFYVHLKSEFGCMTAFTYPLTRCGELGCSKPRLMQSRDKLLELGLLKISHRGGRFSPAYAASQGFKNARGDASVYHLARQTCCDRHAAIDMRRPRLETDAEAFSGQGRRGWSRSPPSGASVREDGSKLCFAR